MSLPLAGAPILAADLTSIFPVGVDAWEPYVPVWTASGTAPALGNGTIGGSVWKAGRSVFFRVILNWGTTTTNGTGNYFLSMPYAAAAQGMVIGRATMVDSSGGTRNNRDMIISSATTFSLTTEAGVAVAATVPWTWASGDFIFAQGFYEASS